MYCGLLGEHEIRKRQERALCVAVRTMDEDLPGLRGKEFHWDVPIRIVILVLTHIWRRFGVRQLMHPLAHDLQWI